MTDPAVEAVARVIAEWDDPGAQEWEMSRYRACAQVAIAALREQGCGPITPEMKAVCEAAKEYFDHCKNVADGLVDDPTTVNASINRLEADRNTTLQAALVLGRALLKEDGNHEG